LAVGVAQDIREEKLNIDLQIYLDGELWAMRRWPVVPSIKDELVVLEKDGTPVFAIVANVRWLPQKSLSDIAQVNVYTTRPKAKKPPAPRKK
jgi:hypothetical protein